MQNDAVEVFLVGRHTGAEIPGIRVKEQINMLWKTEKQGSIDQLRELVFRAHKEGVALLFQNTPTIVTAAITDMLLQGGGQLPVRIGLIISKPGTREADVEESFEFTVSDEDEFQRFCKFINPRARVSVSGAISGTIDAKVDPISSWELVSIEWL